MALNFRVLTIGGAVSFVAGVLWKVQTSPWVRGNLSWLSNALASGATPIQILIIIGAVLFAFGLFWGRWIPAVVLGIIFALGIYVLTFL